MPGELSAGRPVAATSRRGLLAGGLAAALAAGGAARATEGAAERASSQRLVTAPDGASFRLDLSMPAGPAPAGGYPLMVVLDANAWFGVAAALAQATEEELGPLVVAGVGYPGAARFDSRRLRDLTPCPPETPLDGEQTGLAVGGADAFADVLMGPIMTEIGRQAPLTPGRASLFGHSLGGLFALHLLLTRPQAFDAYVAASPSIWWNRPVLLREAESARLGANRRVLFTAGGLEETLSQADIAYLRRSFGANPAAYGGRTLQQVTDDSAARLAGYHMPGYAREMAALLKGKGVDAAYVEFPGETHASSAVAALNRAVRLAGQMPKDG